MKQEKKKLGHYTDLEEHTIRWAAYRLEEIKDMASEIHHDKSLDEEEKEMVYGGLAERVVHLVELLDPLRHDEDSLLEWAAEFIDDWEGYDVADYNT